MSEYLEKKYYPIYWKINNDEIEISDRNGNIIWGLNSPHIKYHKNREDYKKIHKLLVKRNLFYYINFPIRNI